MSFIFSVAQPKPQTKHLYKTDNLSPNEQIGPQALGADSIWSANGSKNQPTTLVAEAGISLKLAYITI